MRAGMCVLLGLLLDGGDYGGVTVADVHRADAAGKVEIAIAVHIHQPGARAAGGKDRVIGEHAARQIARALVLQRLSCRARRPTCCRLGRLGQLLLAKRWLHGRCFELLRHRQRSFPV